MGNAVRAMGNAVRAMGNAVRELSTMRCALWVMHILTEN